ncbi:MAG TPA: asparagine synthase B, partial [Anseongella sp.]
MCGISGYWRAGGLDQTGPERLKAMTEVLRHRGPDGFRYHLDQEKGLAMGHARLSIIDLDTGDQPLYNTDKTRVLTVNGEFYDY